MKAVRDCSEQAFWHSGIRKQSETKKEERWIISLIQLCFKFALFCMLLVTIGGWTALRLQLYYFPNLAFLKELCMGGLLSVNLTYLYTVVQNVNNLKRKSE